MASLRISFYTIVKVRTWQIQKRVIVLHFNPYHREGGDELKEMLVDEYVRILRKRDKTIAVERAK